MTAMDSFAGLRGGNWGSDSNSVSSSLRLNGDPSSKSNGIGFRLAGPV